MKILATAEFTEDMAARLYFQFWAFAKDDRVTLEVADNGVWLVNPDAGTRQFLGSTGSTLS